MIYKLLLMIKLKFVFIFSVFILSFSKISAQANQLSVIAYYSGGPQPLDSFSIEKLTHIIFSFSHLKGNELHINNARDTATIQKLVSLKSQNPGLKVLLSLGGWGGCGPCSEIFSSKKDRKIFTKSVKKTKQIFCY